MDPRSSQECGRPKEFALGRLSCALPSCLHGVVCVAHEVCTLVLARLLGLATALLGALARLLVQVRVIPWSM